MKRNSYRTIYLSIIILLLCGPTWATQSYDVVPLKEHLETVFNQKFIDIDKQIAEARRLMEKTMAGFPGEYAKKLELEQTANTLKEIKERDLRELKDLITNKISREEYASQHQLLLTKAQGWETIQADINGRLWTLGIAGAVLLIIIEVLFRYVLKV